MCNVPLNIFNRGGSQNLLISKMFVAEGPDDAHVSLHGEPLDRTYRRPQAPAPLHKYVVSITTNCTFAVGACSGA